MQDKKTKNLKYDRPNSSMKTLRFEDDLLEQIVAQAKKDNEPFAGWVKKACKMRLNTD